MNRKMQGFTLIEVVVAMAILAMISVMGWQAMDLVLETNNRSENELADELAMQAAWSVLASDLIHLRAQPWQDGLGGIEPAYEAGTGTRERLSLTRGGEAATVQNPAGLTRVQYVLEDAVLYRQSLPAHLSPRENVPVRRVLLEGVRELRFEQPDRENYYGPLWPPLNEERALTSLPPMIRVTLILDDGSQTSQVFPGVGNAGS